MNIIIHGICTHLRPIIDGVVVDDHFVDLAIFAKKLVFLQYFRISQSRRQADDKDKISLDHAERNRGILHNKILSGP